MFKDRKSKLGPPFKGPGVDKDILEEEKEFYYALGRAVSQWAQVEERLFLLYQKMIHSENHLGVNMSFHTTVNVNIKIDMVNNILLATYTDKNIRKAWKDLLKSIRDNNTKRSHIGHYSTMFNISHQIGDKMYLMPSVMNLKAAMDGKTLNEEYTYNTVKLEELVPVFAKLADDIHEFVIHLPYPGQKK